MIILVLAVGFVTIYSTIYKAETERIVKLAKIETSQPSESPENVTIPKLNVERIVPKNTTIKKARMARTF